MSNSPVVTHKGKHYTVRPLADGHHWRLSEVDCPRNSFTLNRDQMKLAGFENAMEVKS
ncbi:hypothetical protein LCF16_003979 [Salmonella enterica]|nr:hypothetical protein [Salmonella enterica]